MSDEDKFKVLQQKRRLVHSRINQIIKSINAYPTTAPDLETLEFDLAAIQELHADNNALFDTLADLSVTSITSDQVSKEEVELLSLNESMKKCSIAIQRRISAISTAKGTPVSSPSTPASVPNVRLPKIELPKFEGNYEEWLSFKDMFSALVINNSSLSDAQRLQYLKSVAVGEAAAMIKAFTVIDSNFPPAWKTLEDRYENEREIVFAILKRLVYQSSLKSENATALRKLLDNSLECIKSLEVMKQPVDKWDTILVFIIMNQMDPESKKEFAKTLTSTTIPSLDEFKDFVEGHIRSLNAFGSGKDKAASGTKERAQTHHASSTGDEPSFPPCQCCGSKHPLYKCQKFLSSPLEEKNKLVQCNKLCYNCFSPKHGSRNCSSKMKCKACHKPHHTLLHRSNENSAPAAHQAPYSSSMQQPNLPSQAPTSENPPSHPPPTFQNFVPQRTPDASQNTSATIHHSSTNGELILLSTAMACVEDIDGNKITCRVFLDKGSEPTIVSEALVQKLKIPRHRSYKELKGMGGVKLGKSHGMVKLFLSSFYCDYEFCVEAEVVPKPTDYLPSRPCNPDLLTHIRGLQLADPQFYIPGPVDIIIGAKYEARLMLSGKVMGPLQLPVAQESVFGWVLSGPIPTYPSHQLSSYHVHHCQSQMESEHILNKFWALDAVPNRPFLTKEEKYCEDHFIKNHTRDSTGRYVVSMPFNEKISSLGYSRDTAQRRLLQVEKRLNKDPEHKEQYHQFMKEYEELGHMVPVPASEAAPPPPHSYYLPHHFVLKEESTTTKLRVVFDGSASTTSGLSLNNCLQVGPMVQEDLFSVLLRFRIHPIAIKADIAKMYRQFLINPDHQSFQLILWRYSQDDPITTYKLKTVTYGLASSSFLATRSLKQLVLDEGHEYPEAASILSSDIVVDDVLTGASTLEEAVQVRKQLSNLISKGGMELRKFEANSPEFIQSIPDHLVETKHVHFFGDMSSQQFGKALGIGWNPRTDEFNFNKYEIKPPIQLTKRAVLSELARIFDPLGFLAPITVKIKMLFQSICISITDSPDKNLGWDAPVPQGLISTWNECVEDMKLISQVKLPRCITSPQAQSYELHGFSDSSEKAYSACVYLRSFLESGEIISHLVAAKTRIAPIKQVTLPRLELCGSLLLSSFLPTIKSALRLDCSIYTWTDSEIVLHWVSSSSRRYKTFVANRISAIQEEIPSEAWRYVPSEQNPADCATRGLTASSLIKFDLWWYGPTWLTEPGLPTFTHNASKPDLDHKNLEERKLVHLVQTSIHSSLIEKFSSLHKLVRVLSYVRRFVQSLRERKRFPMKSITASEYDMSFHELILHAQEDDFSTEIQSLEKDLPLPSSSKLKTLNPFIDQIHVLRVGGRLAYSSVPHSTKYPILLSASHPLTRLIVRQAHLDLLHAGQKLMTTYLLRRFWILRGRNLIRDTVRRCIKCRRFNSKMMNQLMGNLPSPRVSPSHPFLHVGIDYAGPFTTQTIRGRGQKQFKSYFCIFVCLAVKAVHLEMVTDLTTDSFISTLRRFVSRRGFCTDIYSDQGTNFTGAEKELQVLLQQSKDQFSSELSVKGITFHFNPPSAPHQGGLWEAGVKSVKNHLRKVAGSHTLTFEEFNTLLCQIEAILNSRPLCAVSSNPEDFDVLTPGHFLVGRPLVAVPEPSLLHLNENRLSRWQLVQKMTHDFWNRWKHEYVTSLQQRYKWKTQRPNLAKGELVLIIDENQPPLRWKMGRVIELFPGKDNLVRVCKLKTSNGEIMRPIHKLCPLLSQEDI